MTIHPQLPPPDLPTGNQGRLPNSLQRRSEARGFLRESQDALSEFLEAQLPKALQGGHLADLLAGRGLVPGAGLALVAECQEAGDEGHCSQQADNQGANVSSRFDGSIRQRK